MSLQLSTKLLGTSLNTVSDVLVHSCGGALVNHPLPDVRTSKPNFT